MDHIGYTSQDVRCAQSPRLLRLPMSSADQLKQGGYFRLHLQRVHLFAVKYAGIAIITSIVIDFYYFLGSSASSSACSLNLLSI